MKTLNAGELWGQAVARLRQDIGEENAELWLKPIEAASLEDGVLLLMPTLPQLYYSLYGGIATGIFATASVTGGAEGLLAGDSGQFVDQLIGVFATLGYSFAMTFIILKVVDVVIGLRVKRDVEVEGLDINLHGETVH